MDSDSYRRLIQHIGQIARGKRLAEVMVMVASAGCWPKARKSDMIKNFAGGRDGDRCKQGPEDLLHRYWKCDANKGSKAYDDSEDEEKILICKANLGLGNLTTATTMGKS